MSPSAFCNCLPGATLWLEGPASLGIAGDLSERLRTTHHRRVEVLDAEALGTPDERPEAVTRRIGLVAEILGRNGILTVVARAGDTEEADREAVRARHERAGIAFLTVRADGPAPTADSLLTQLTGHGLVLPG